MAGWNSHVKFPSLFKFNEHTRFITIYLNIKRFYTFLFNSFSFMAVNTFLV